MKVKKLVFYVLILMLLSCANKEVQLPIIEIEGIQEIQNHSSIWVFFEIQNKDTVAVLNKNNKLLNTHWIFNVDKRLNMGQIIPVLQKMQDNRNKDSMHKKEGMLNYYSYANTESNTISLLPFNSTTYSYSKEESHKFLTNLGERQILELEIINGGLLVNNMKVLEHELIQKLANIKETDSLTDQLIILKYMQKTKYDRYLMTKAILFKTDLEVSSTEFIFN